MARDIGRRNKTGLPVAIRMPAVPAAVTIERTDGSASPVAIEVKAEVEWSISFNPRDLEDYRYAIRQLRLAVSLHHVKAQARSDGREFVFGEGAGPYSGLSQRKAALDKDIARLRGGKPLPAWVHHDLRRSTATGMDWHSAAHHRGRS